MALTYENNWYFKMIYDNNPVMPKEIVDSFDAIVKLTKLDLNDCYLGVSGHSKLPDILNNFEGTVFPDKYRSICSKLLFHSLGIKTSDCWGFDNELVERFSECVWTLYKLCINKQIIGGDK